MNNIKVEFERWKNNATEDIDLIKELNSLSEEQIQDAFYKDLEFGTGGLRGVIGVGTNRMNIYTVAKATQGLANYINRHYKKEDRLVAISRDSRLKSDLFSEITARVFAGNNIKVRIYPYISPVPTLSYATRYFKAAAGVMITASHNPSKYNGYKVYGSDGCQITNEAADEILADIEKTDVFNDTKIMRFDEGFEKGLIKYIEPITLTSFIEEVKKTSLLGGELIDKNASIVYSPLNGTGLKCVTRALKEAGYTNITVVKEQEFPNGYFPTCSYPNPEIKEAMALGMEYAKNHNADLLLATDPDCDRVGIAIKNKNDEYQLLTGNETGMLLLDYICSRRITLNIMPKDPIMVKTIVTIDMAERIAASYGVKTYDVLTGFKYIGEIIGKLEKEGKEKSYIFGFEESYGCLSGTYVRDKDAVNGAFLIVEMFSYYKSKGISLLDKLDELYKKFGYTLNTLYSFEFDGTEGFTKMNNIMDSFRKDIKEFGDKKVLKVLDYNKGIDGLPKSNVIKFILSDNSSLVVRPSGTEPKLKTYLSISSINKEEAKKEEQKLHESVLKFIK